ncbi:hypothetical protein H632_c3528p0, partial [Helicosporidium sp. ATCC 50920]
SPTDSPAGTPDSPAPDTPEGSPEAPGPRQGTWVWGSNSLSQLGAPGSSAHAPRALADTYETVAGGKDFACGVLRDMTVQCWGANSLFQSGQSSGVTVATPTTVAGAQCVDQLSAGTAHVCVRNTGNNVLCWGSNVDGQLGNGSTINTSTPGVVSLSADFSQVSAGDNHTCAVVKTVGSLYCWGGNESYQLGDGTQTSSSTPLQVGSGAWEAAAAGLSATCALEAQNQGVQCWGSNQYGQSGTGSEELYTETPTTLNQLLGIPQAIDGRGGMFCSLASNGIAMCWGLGSSGQIGNGSTQETNGTPAQVSSPDALTALSVGGSHACATTSAGGLVCWGDNGAGQLGLGTNVALYAWPQAVDLLPSSFSAAWDNTYAVGIRSTWESPDSPAG